MPRSRRVVAYVRPGARLLASGQIEAIRDAAAERSWRILDVVEEELEAGTGLDRPALRRALELCARGEAHILVVAQLDRLAASLVDLGTVAEWFLASDSALVSLDLPDIDTSTDLGEQLARACVAMANWERSLVATRTQDELAARRLRGLRISRPALSDDRPELYREIRALRDAEWTLQEICDLLNGRGEPTVRGGRVWRPSSLQSTLGQPRSRPRRVVLLPAPRPPGVAGRRSES
jgi:DNA invertase Pin-like site-specific DNA recombinase